MGGVTTSKGTAGHINKSDDQKGGAYDPKRRAANLAKLKDLIVEMETLCRRNANFMS